MKKSSKKYYSSSSDVFEDNAKQEKLLQKLHLTLLNTSMSEKELKLLKGMFLRKGLRDQDSNYSLNQA